MSRLNTALTKLSRRAKTHGGSVAQTVSAEQELRRTVMSCMLWENTFYENGVDVADRIQSLAAQVDPDTLGQMALEARHDMHLRHAPLLLLCALVGHQKRPTALTTREYIFMTLTRADEICELLAMYWREGRKPIAKQLKLGLAAAFCKFDEYEFAKYNRPADIKLRDVMFLVRPKPVDEKQAELFQKIADDKLATPDTWETNLSMGANKRETFTRLLREERLGYLALLRNLRNMQDAGVDKHLVESAIFRQKGSRRVLPFRYIAAAKAAPQFERAIDTALCEKVAGSKKFPGKTFILVDVSASMNARLSAKSDMTRMDAAATLAAVFPSDDVRVFTFSYTLVEVPPRIGVAGVDAIIGSQPHGGTALSEAIAAVNAVEHDRLIVITDEQSTSRSRTPDPVAPLGYMINVASYQNGVGYGKWTHIDGFSERVLNWMHEYEEEKVAA